MNLKKFYLISISIMSLAGLNAQTTYAKIVVYRNETSTVEDEEDYKIYTDDNLTTSLKNNQIEEFYMPEGNFRLRINDQNSTTLTVQCSKGKIYYFKIYRDLSLKNKQIAIVAVDSSTVNSDMKYVKKYVKKSSSIQASTFNMERKNAIGVVIEPGRGFKKVGMISTTSGTEAMLSFGGGGVIGLNYSRELSDFFGWSVELEDQFSSLTPNLSNATVDFNRGIISTTPYFSIPLSTRNEQKLKIGAGLDYHFNPVLTFDTEKLVNGFKDEWTYDNTMGYHLIAFFETKLGKNLRGHSGLKYSDARYTFVSGKTYQPDTPDLKIPRGNSLAVSLGLEYCF